jgi:serine/alanine adding enzyme
VSRAAAATALRDVEPAAWDALLAELGCDDAYLSRAYVESACILDSGRPAFVHADGPGGEVAFGCIVREIPGADGLRDVTTPYGFSGPVASGPDPPVERFWALYEEWADANAVVSTFVRFHPLAENPRHAPPGGRLERLADAATWRLDRGGDLFAEMHRSHRNKCRKARAAGVEVALETAPTKLDDFLALHEDTMRRRGASAFYFFPSAYWDALAAGFGDRLVRLDARLDGELVASELCLAGPRWLHYHMGVTSEAGRAVGAANVLVYEAARWAREAGLEQLNLGSGLGGRKDSLWEFKQRFSPDPGREFWIAKLVHDEDAYARLAGDAANRDGFFPAYREPRPAASSA